MKYNTRYLFEAQYKDGQIYRQNADDISVADPTKSCYYDVKVDDVEYFTLSDGKSVYVLDLKDGGFCINCADKIYLTIDTLYNFKLVYFKRVTLSITEDSRSVTVNYVLGYTAVDGEGTQVSKSIIIR